MRHLLRPTTAKRTAFFVIADLLLSLGTLYTAYLLRFNLHIPPQFFGSFWTVFIVLVGLKMGFLALFRSYRIVWRFFSLIDARYLLIAHLLAYGVFAAIYLLFPHLFIPFPRSVIVIDFSLSLMLLGMLRISKRLVTETLVQTSVKPTIILGVSSKTATIIQSAMKHEIDYYPVAVVAAEHEKSLQNAYISNVRVYGPDQLENVVDKFGVEAVVLAADLSQTRLRAFVERLNQAGVREIKRIGLVGTRRERLKDLSIEDLLARHPKDLDTEMIAAFIEGKRVLITGAGGSIGSEIVRQCRKFGAKALTLVESSEYNLYRIGEQVPDADLRLLSVTDKQGLEVLFSQVSPDIVIHAAAYKHVPICEHNPESAVINNIVGTKNVIDVSIAHHVEKVVIISTDKAVRPTNVMGATKRVSELYAQNVPNGTTEIVAVRFGNVLGSSGSVIPKFKEQIEKGGPVTVTHPEMTRYFMLIPEACQLVLQAAAIAKGGELFILDMGEPVKIVDLARTMIRLYGKEGEVEIAFTGLRPGEKMYEELLISESEQKTRYSSIFVAAPTEYPYEQLIEDIAMLLQECDKCKGLRKIVPEYTPKENL